MRAVGGCSRGWGSTSTVPDPDGAEGSIRRHDRIVIRYDRYDRDGLHDRPVIPGVTDRAPLT